MKKIVILIFLCGFFGFSQDLPEIVPPSPRAETFHIYGDIPVAHNTGVPDISIPLYTIESDGIAVPIVLRYHTASIKPGRDNSNIAFGWTLDVGGRISRTVNQWPDEYVQRPATFKLTDDLNPDDDDDFTYLNQASGVNGAYFDTQYDIFSYSALGDYGKFIINNQEGSNISIHELIESPKKFDLNTAINTDFSITEESIDYFTSVNGIGQTFYFGENNNYEVVESGSLWGRAPSSWLLTKIVSADKSSSVDFSYESVPLELQNTATWADSYGSSPHDYQVAIGFGTNGINPICQNDFLPAGSISYEVKTVKEINFNDGKVIFNLSTDKKRINSIEVRDDNNVLIKSIDFIRSFFYDPNFPNQTAFEKLESIEINDQNDSAVKIFDFEYFDYGMPREDETDFWGYFNNQDNYSYQREITSVTNNLSSSIPFTCQSESGNKNASLLYSKSYVLNKITYPTGGFTEFDYELNQFTGYWPGSGGGQIVNGGGLRVKSITSKPDQSSSTIIKTYQYNPRDFNEQTPKNPLNTYNYTTTSYFINGGIDLERYRSRNFSHGFNGNLLDTHINYEEITEYQGTTSVNTGKIVYTYEYELENKYWNKNVVDPIYQYDFGNLDQTNQDDLGYNKLIEYRNGEGGKLKETEYFNNDNGTYTPVRKITNTYDYKLNLNEFENLNVVSICSYSQGDNLDDFLFRRDHPSFHPKDPKMLPVLGSYDSYVYQSRANLIKQEVTQINEDLTEITATTEYSYNSNALITEQTVYDSKGNTYSAKTLYPDNIQTASTLESGEALVGGGLSTSEFNTITDMKGDLNQVAIPVQVETYQDNGSSETLLSLQRTNFYQPYTDVILPKEVQTLKGTYNSSTNPLEDRIVFHDYYSNGNVKEVSKQDGSHIYYVWGYNEQYPIAKLENFESSQITITVQNLINAAVTASDNDDSVSDENTLRTALSNLRNTSALASAMVTTYTYDPLVGVTSMTDPRGYTIYYEYDEFNRLEFVKDADDNLVSENKYNYKN